MSECRICKRVFGGFRGVAKPYAMLVDEAITRGVDPTGLCTECLEAELDKAPTLEEMRQKAKEQAEKRRREEEQRRREEELYATEMEKKFKIRKDLRVKYSPKIDAIVVATFPPPAEWTKEIIGIVNGSSVIGTGPLVSLASIITDFFGTEAYGHIEKIEKAKNNAIQRLKEDAFLLGANMVFGVQININEITVGEGNSMLFVAATGTALNHKEE